MVRKVKESAVNILKTINSSITVIPFSVIYSPCSHLIHVSLYRERIHYFSSGIVEDFCFPMYRPCLALDTSHSFCSLHTNLSATVFIPRGCFCQKQSFITFQRIYVNANLIAIKLINCGKRPINTLCSLINPTAERNGSKAR